MDIYVATTHFVVGGVGEGRGAALLPHAASETVGKGHAFGCNCVVCILPAIISVIILYVTFDAKGMLLFIHCLKYVLFPETMLWAQ